MSSKQIDSAAFEHCKEVINQCKEEIAKRVVGQDSVIDGILTALVADGHVLLEGVPGLAKTLAVKTISDISGFDFKRIQFTPDLLPADITGTLIYEQNSGNFSVRKGPVMAPGLQSTGSVVAIHRLTCHPSSLPGRGL